MSWHREHLLLASILAAIVVGAVTSGAIYWAYGAHTAVLPDQTQNVVTIGDLMSAVLALPGITVPIILTYVAFRNEDVQAEIGTTLTLAMRKLGYRWDQISPAVGYAAAEQAKGVLRKEREDSLTALKTLDALSKIQDQYKPAHGTYEPMAKAVSDEVFDFQPVNGSRYCYYFEARTDMRYLQRMSVVLVGVWIALAIWMIHRVMHGPVAGWVPMELGFCAAVAMLNLAAYVVMWIGNDQRQEVRRCIAWRIHKLASSGAVLIHDHVEYIKRTEEALDEGSGFEKQNGAPVPKAKARAAKQPA